MMAASNLIITPSSEQSVPYARPQKPPVRRIRRRRRPLGHRLLVHHHRQVQQCRALRLSQERARAHVRRSPDEPARRTPALELALLDRPQLTPRVRIQRLLIRRDRQIWRPCEKTGTLLLAMRSLSTLAATEWIRIPIAYTLIDARANSRSRNSRRRILPVMVIGSSERYSTARGYL